MLFIVSFCATILLSFLIYHKLTLLHFINLSFFIAGAFLFLALLTITVKGGFFDGITYGFRRTFISKGKVLSKNEVKEMKPISEMITFHYSPLLINGLLMLAIMLIALFIYYYR
ncbi:hypothetical protein WQ54_03115 [Bacillus sp. SA1-12]|nr:hypothetical protein WQ54_03115 [Bacillus sp. SA1-12]